MMFVCLSVRLSGTDVYCDHTLHCSADLSLWLDSSCVLGTPRPQHVHLLPAVFSSSTWKRGGVWMYKLGAISQERLKIEVKLLLSANRMSHMSRRLAQRQRAMRETPVQGHSRSSVVVSIATDHLNCPLPPDSRFQNPDLSVAPAFLQFLILRLSLQSCLATRVFRTWCKPAIELQNRKVPRRWGLKRGCPPLKWGHSGNRSKFCNSMFTQNCIVLSVSPRVCSGAVRIGPTPFPDRRS